MKGKGSSRARHTTSLTAYETPFHKRLFRSHSAHSPDFATTATNQRLYLYHARGWRECNALFSNGFIALQW
jgi:hypothetical protein